MPLSAADKDRLLSVPDGATGKPSLDDVHAARDVEVAFGSQVKHVPVERLPNGNAIKGPDYEFVEGPYAGKTFDFMYTDSKAASFINGKFDTGYELRNVVRHLDKPNTDYVILDFRTLTPDNRSRLYTEMRNQLTPEQNRRIIILNN